MRDDKAKGKIGWIRRVWRGLVAITRLKRVRLLAKVVAGIVALALLSRFTYDPALERYDEDDIEGHFKYGSLGTEYVFGMPQNLWHTFPVLFEDHLPRKDEGFRSFGMIYEEGRDFPIGTSQRRVLGFDRVWLNCALCHTGTVRDAPVDEPTIVLGMPANTFDFHAFMQFFFDASRDHRFTPIRLLREAEAAGHPYHPFDRLLMRLVGVNMLRDRTLEVADRLRIFEEQPPWGPGRVDTFNAAKVLFGFLTDELPEREKLGTTDFPSIWNQRQREGMQLHWDGNNTSVRERNRSAAIGAGVTPPTLEREAIERIEDWLLDLAPPSFGDRYAIDEALADRGRPIYAEYCARCHGASGTEFNGELVGTVVPIDEIGTDRFRLDSYTLELSANQNTFFTGYEQERFKRFRKTYGYANMPLDGLWLRAPYLHNGSVPTLRDLLEPSAERPERFYRGNDVYDPERVGFVSDVPAYGDRDFFLFDTSVDGNGNAGHEGRRYGTALPDADKEALLEYLKTF